jgi:hypothetical protein
LTDIQFFAFVELPIAAIPATIFQPGIGGRSGQQQV